MPNELGAGDVNGELATALQDMTEPARVAFLDFVDLGPKRRLTDLLKKYEQATAAGLDEEADDGFLVVPTTSRGTLSQWANKYNWKDLSSLAWAQRQSALQSEAVGMVHAYAGESIQKLYDLMSAERGIVLRKGGRNGDDELGWVPDNDIRFQAAKTLANLAGIIPARVSISERIAQNADGSEIGRERLIEYEGRSAADIAQSLNARLTAPPG